MTTRGISNGLGALLIALGGAALFAGALADSVLARPFAWHGPYAIAGEASVVAGLALVALALGAVRRTQAKRRQIARLTASGNELMDRLEASPLRDAEGLRHLYDEIEAWALEVHRWLAGHVRDSVALFENRGAAGRSLWGDVPAGDERERPSDLYAVNHYRLSSRLQRLSEIAASL